MINLSKKNRGFTLIEIMITVSIVGIIILVSTSVFNSTQKLFSYYDVFNHLKMTGQELVNKINVNILENKRLFENNAVGAAYLGILEVDGSIPVLAGSQLPTIETTGSLSPSSAAFVPGSVGNSLFFVSTDVPAQFDNILDSTGNISNIRVDICRFHYYYLTQDNTANIGNRGFRYDLILWKSINYAIFSQINTTAIPDATKRANTVIALRNNGVFFAWNYSDDDVTTAFYALDAAGGINLVPGHTIPQVSADKIKMITGTLGGGFKYGVSFNTDAGFQTGVQVPNFATVNGTFPGGFETIIVGYSGGRRVLVRLVLVAQGINGLNAQEQVSLSLASDLW